MWIGSWFFQELEITARQDHYTSLEETSSWYSQSQYSHSVEGSGLQGSRSSVIFSLQDTIKMALAMLNLETLPPVLGSSILLCHPVAKPEDFQITSCPDFDCPVFWSAPSSRPDRVACTLAAMAETRIKSFLTCFLDFLDGWLLYTRSPQQAANNTQHLLHHFATLGLKVNL